jgi:DNA-binding GntR family transcriptional regulator
MRDSILSRVQSDIVAKIIDYVRRGNLPVDSRLTESQLAEEFGVSRSPIRAAQNWTRLSEQKFRIDKWSVCRG